MSKSISISNPDQLVSLIVEPNAGPKIGGTLNLSIFTSASYIDVSDNGIEDFGTLPGNLETFNCSKNKISNIPSTFGVSDKLLNIDLHENSLTELDIERILVPFIAAGDVSGVSPQPVIDISKFGNAVPNSAGLGYITTLQNFGWNVKYNPGEYVLSTDAVNVSEGGLGLKINIDRTISNIADGEVIPFTISGVQTADFTSAGFDGGAAPSNLQGSFTIANNSASATFNLKSDVGVSKHLEGESLVMKIYQLTGITSESSPPLPDGSYNITVRGNPIALDIASGSATNDISALQIYVPEETSTLAVPLASNGVTSLSTINFFSIPGTTQGKGYSIDTNVATTTNGSGTNLTVDINTLGALGSLGAGTNAVTINTPGTGYLPNDIITITNPLGVGAIIRGTQLDGDYSTGIMHSGNGYAPGTTMNVPVIYDSSQPNWHRRNDSPPYTGNGVNFTVDVTADANGDVTKLEINNHGTGYELYDRLIVNAGDVNARINVSAVSKEATTYVLETLGDINLTLTGTLVDEISVPIVDTTPQPYSLTTITSETEGQSFNINISTTIGTTVSDGTTVPYTITGIQANDIAEALTGNFTLTSNTDTITINLEANSPIDENETMTIKLDDYPTSASIRIFDI